MCRNLIPLDSSPSPRLVTSLFYRIGRPQPAPAYTSLQTAVWVFAPSCWNKTGRPSKEARVQMRESLVNPLGRRAQYTLSSCSEWVKESLRNFILSRQPMSAAQCASRRRRAVHESSSSNRVGGAACSPRVSFYLIVQTNVLLLLFWTLCLLFMWDNRGHSRPGMLNISPESQNGPPIRVWSKPLDGLENVKILKKESIIFFRFFFLFCVKKKIHTKKCKMLPCLARPKK